MRSGAAVTGSLYTHAGQRKYLTPDERRRFIIAANACGRPDLRTLCLTLAYTGCRISEALSLTASAIETGSGFIALRTLKQHRRETIIREIPVPAHVLAAIDEVHDLDHMARDARLWTISRCRAWQLAKAVMRAAGISEGLHATPKGLRHGFGIHAIRSGVPINLVQRWLGHARMETTAIYLQAMGSEEREIAARMWASDETPRS